MYGAKYLPAIPVLATLAFFALGLAASQSAQFLLVAAERQVFYIVWLLVSAAIDVLGCQLFIPHTARSARPTQKGSASWSRPPASSVSWSSNST